MIEVSSGDHIYYPIKTSLIKIIKIKKNKIIFPVIANVKYRIILNKRINDDSE